nr:hypothetical protein [Microvirga aerophila]
MVGGSGQDSFFFDAVGGSSSDVIADFYSPEDSIRLYTSRFSSLTPGALQFLASSEDELNGAGIIYDMQRGALLYDTDGAGGLAAEMFAQVVYGTRIAADDFQIFSGLAY